MDNELFLGKVKVMKKVAKGGLEVKVPKVKEIKQYEPKRPLFKWVFL